MGRKCKVTNDNIVPSAEARREAKLNPGGWVYEIDGHFLPTEHVPYYRIRGAWKVDDNGDIIGAFMCNPNYRPSSAK